jgi:hypothetical protein
LASSVEPVRPSSAAKVKSATPQVAAVMASVLIQQTPGDRVGRLRMLRAPSVRTLRLDHPIDPPQQRSVAFAHPRTNFATPPSAGSVPAR